MSKKILIFGGSGFIGYSLTNLLLKKGHKVCVICSNMKKAQGLFGNNENLEIRNINIFDTKQLINSIKDQDVIINLIGKLFEVKKGDFDKFHHHFPEILSQNCLNKQKLIHISALGVEKSSATSAYGASKLNGENAIRDNCKNYNIVKPSIVFGEKDNFFNQFANMAKFSPFLPLIGGGKSRFSPIYVEDLSLAILKLAENDTYLNQTFEAHGNSDTSFKEILQFILKTTKRKRILLPLPFFAAKLQAKILNFLRIFLLTSDQVELLKYDNISNKQHKNIDAIIGNLENYKKIVPKYLN